jgi:hypothetical protein
MHYGAFFAIVCGLVLAGFLLDKWYRRLWGRTGGESYWPLTVFLLFVGGVLLSALLNKLLLVPIVVVPVTLFAWWRYWAKDRSSQDGDR